MGRCFIRNKASLFIIIVLTIGLGSSVVVSAKDDTPKAKLLENIAVIKRRIKNLEEMVKKNQFGNLQEEIMPIKEELDSMIENKSIEQIEADLSKSAKDAQQQRIREIEERLNEKARKEKKGKSR